MLRAAIRQSLFRQNVLRENLPKFNMSKFPDIQYCIIVVAICIY